MGIKKERTKIDIDEMVDSKNERMSWFKKKCVKYGELFVIKYTHDELYARKWVIKIFNFWNIILKIVGTIAIIIIVKNKAYGMIDNIGFEKTIITFVVVLTIVTIKNSRFIRADE